MTIRTTWLREYMDWRARMVSIATVLLMIVAGIALAFMVSEVPARLAQLGIFLQFLGALALAPDVIGRDTVLGGNIPVISARRDLLRLYERKNRSILVGNAIASTIMIGLLVYSLITAGPAAPYITLIGSAGMLAFAWGNLVMILYVCRFLEVSVPEGVYYWFLPIDFLITIPGLIFSALMHVLLVWLPKLMGFVFQNGITRVALIVTLPCFLVGLMFELIGSF